MTHQRGEAVQVGDATVVFRGVEDRDGSLYAVFEIVSGSLPPARLLAVGATYALEPGAAANRLEAGPLPSDELATDTELTLNVGEQFVVFEAGEVLPAK